MKERQRFEDLIVWNKSKELTLEIYSNFKDLKDFSFRDQIQRASLSVMNNIAEGFERQSQKELKQFLFIAKGSCGEVRSMLYVALELGHITKSNFEKLNSKTVEVSKLLSGFIKKVDS